MGKRGRRLTWDNGAVIDNLSAIRLLKELEVDQKNPLLLRNGKLPEIPRIGTLLPEDMYEGARYLLEQWVDEDKRHEDLASLEAEFCSLSHMRIMAIWLCCRRKPRIRCHSN